MMLGMSGAGHSTQHCANSPPDGVRHGTVPELPCARLVQVSDPHLLENPEESHRSVNTSTTFERVLSKAQALIGQSDAVLLTGDVAQDEAAATYARLRQSWVDSWVGPHTPVWCVPGNHDAPVLMSSELQYPPFHWLGHHQLGNWEIVLLDSRNPGKASGLLGEEEIQRLGTVLAASDAEHVLVVLHHQPITLGHTWLDSVGLQDRDALFELIHDDKRVRAVVFGHIHHVVDRMERGIRYLGCPSTGAQFTPHRTDFEVDQRPPGFRTLTLYPSGTLTTSVLWLTGSGASSPHAPLTG